MNGSPFIFSNNRQIPSAQTWADLPSANDKYQELYWVVETTGIWPFNQKSAGIYRSDGTTWVYGGELLQTSEIEILGSSVQLFNQTTDSSVSVGHAVYYDASGVLQKASAASINASSLAGFISSKSSASVGNLITSGLSSSIFSGLVAGQPYYLGLIPGSIMDSPPTGSGEVVIFIGYAISATEILLKEGTRLVRAL